MAPKELVPVVPEWCDCTYRNRDPRKSCIFLGACRVALALISFILCAIFIANPYDINDDYYGQEHYSITYIRGILILICLINLVHLAAAVFLILMARGNMNNTPQMRRWLIVDLAITGAYVVCVLILIFSLPPHRLYLILGFKMIILSLLFCYRAGATYLVFRSQENEVLVHVASPDGTAYETRYDNVYRV